MPTANTPVFSPWPRLFLVEDAVLDAGTAAPAVLTGPRDAGPPAFVQLALPRLRRGDVQRVVVLGEIGGVPGGVLVEPRQRLGPELGLLRCLGEVHSSGSY